MWLRTHLDKTWVGKAEQGFDFLGYQFNREGITVAPATVQRGVTRIRRLDEHNRRRPSQASAVGVYVSRWWRWAEGGVPNLLPLTSAWPSLLPNRAEQPG